MRNLSLNDQTLPAEIAEVGVQMLPVAVIRKLLQVVGVNCPKLSDIRHRLDFGGSKSEGAMAEFIGAAWRDSTVIRSAYILLAA
jgi:hypothetical protein